MLWPKGVIRVLDTYSPKGVIARLFSSTIRDVGALIRNFRTIRGMDVNNGVKDFVAGHPEIQSSGGINETYY